MKQGDFTRIGIVGPAGNMALEYEVPRHLPDRVLSDHARLARPGGVELTRGSFAEGPDAVDRVSNRMPAETGMPAITASRTVLDALAALRHLGRLPASGDGRSPFPLLSPEAVATSGAITNTPRNHERTEF